MSKLRVLIAEDEYVSATVLELMVQEEGHEVCGIVSQGRAVVEAVQRLHPDVVLMDVHLADDVSGILATKNLLRQVQVPVIVISATDRPEEQREIAESGALGFIQKPVSPDDLRVNLRIATYHNEIIRRLSASELLHRSLFDNAAVGIYVCHKDGYYLACNRAFARMLGYSGPAEVLRLVHSVDEQVYQDEGRRAFFVSELEKGKSLRDMESQVYGRDGDRIWVAEHLAPHFDENGDFSYYEGVVINISDKKQAEADRALAYSLVQNTMDAIADFVAVVDLEGNIIIANKTFELELGEAAGLRRTLIFDSGGEYGDPMEEFRATVAAAPQEGPKIRRKCRIKGYDSLLDVKVSPYIVADGEIAGAVLVMRAFEEGR